MRSLVGLLDIISTNCGWTVTSEITPFEDYALRILEQLAAHSFILTDEGEMAAKVTGLPIRVLIRKSKTYER